MSYNIAIRNIYIITIFSPFVLSYRQFIYVQLYMYITHGMGNKSTY